MKKAVYPGTFDPVTLGHLDIIQRASHLFDELTVAILINSNKKTMFTLEERIELLKQVTKNFSNVKIDSFSGLLADYCNKRKLHSIVRGLRAISDYEYEIQMAQMNRMLMHDTDTVFLMTSAKYSFLSSSLVKEVASFGGNIQELVSPEVYQGILQKVNGEA